MQIRNKNTKKQTNIQNKTERVIPHDISVCISETYFNLNYSKVMDPRSFFLEL